MTAIAPTKFGRYHVAETPSSMMRMHFHKASTALKVVDHEPKNGVLDQEDLFAQGIDTSVLIPGATRVDALGSCTSQAFHSALSNVKSELDYLAYTKASSYDDTVGIEKAAILFYNGCTDQTGDPSQEWPPTDCGSSGPYIVSYGQKLGLISSDTIASGATNIVSLLQSDGLLVGQPFLNAWMEPGTDAVVDGNGSMSQLESQLRLGVAGGHETYISAIDKLTLLHTGEVDPFKTILRVRNSWAKGWGDNGSYRIHLSTYVALGNYCDFRQLVA